VRFPIENESAAQPDDAVDRQRGDGDLAGVLGRVRDRRVRGDRVGLRRDPVARLDQEAELTNEDDHEALVSQAKRAFRGTYREVPRGSAEQSEGGPVVRSPIEDESPAQPDDEGRPWLYWAWLCLSALFGSFAAGWLFGAWVWR
jgi:hypothetical protein